MFPNYIAYNFLFAELLGRFVYIQDLPYALFPIAILLIIYQVSGHFFKGLVRFLPVVIFLISPWFWYLYEAQSLYVLILFLTLVAAEGIILVGSGRGKLGGIYFVLSYFMLMYASSLFLLLVPVFIIILLTTRVVEFKTIIPALVVLAILTIPLMFMVSRNRTILKYKYDNEIALFRDPGLLNSVNRYQGAATEEGKRYLSKFSQNKYLFYVEYSALKYVSQLIPVTFFTPQYKLLGFSISPPVFAGFTIPFLYGLYRLLQEKKTRKILLVATMLVIPSVLGNEIVSINRLVLFFPVLLIIISYGLVGLKRGRARFFLALTIFLVAFQLILTFIDVKEHEQIRSKTYFGKKYQQIEP